MKKTTILSLVIILYALTTGIAIIILWPSESIVYLNPPAVILGESVYEKAIDTIGEPTSSYAHYTIPWFLRIPQVYFIMSIILYIPIAIIIDWVSKKYMVNTTCFL